ncbi:hypothetical protein GUJ93_ZPchr0006g44218 [Zizania palustris]|uniref:Uncharacterized protein n=1 Tax=Zizania palustris TaxID=103762 RepID=A0A8J5VN69_ZIZPA|nr:hypothetical protein GUJ93_ZPchr0006g44218 [Zizania palustris]KAG8073261.1 hypothetical protein GUJ93_ZPchr0006g44218 [Zizania palustris]
MMNVIPAAYIATHKTDPLPGQGQKIIHFFEDRLFHNRSYDVARNETTEKSTHKNSFCVFIKVLTPEQVTRPKMSTASGIHGS